MIRISLVDKFKSLIDMISSSYVFIIVLGLFIGISIYLFKTVKNDCNKTKKNYIFGYSAIVLTAIIVYNKSIFDLLDYLVNNIFVILCFPNLAVYIAMIVIINIIFIKSIFKKDIDIYIRSINISIYAFIHFMLVLILDTIVKNNVDVYSDISIYTNKNLLNLVELSIGTFVVWMAILAVIHIIKKLTNGEVNERKLSHNTEIVLEPITIFDQNHMLQAEAIYTSNQSTLRADATEELKNMNANNFDNLSIDDYKKLKTVLVQLGKEGK